MRDGQGQSRASVQGASEWDARYRALFEQAADSIVIFDPRTLSILDFNDEACRRLGYSRERFARLTIADVEAVKSAREVRRHSMQVIRGGMAVFETKQRTRTGNVLDVEVRSKPVRVGGRTLIQVICRDITARKRTEAALRHLNETLEQRVSERTADLAESEARFRTIFDTAADGMFLRRLSDCGFELANAACLRMLGYAPDEFRALRLEKLHGKDDVRFIRGEIAKFGKGKAVPRAEVWFRRKDGSWFLAEVTPTAVKFGGKDYVLVTIRDMTERKNAQQARQRLEEQVLEVSEREQRRIGQDLHDGVGQHIVAARLMCSAAAHRLSRDRSPLAETAARVERELGQALEDTRQLARGLHPIRPGADAFMAALHELAEGVERMSNIRCRFVCRRPAPVADLSAATHLYRIAQEAVNNAVRHGHPRNVRMVLDGADGCVLLRVEDDGRGLPTRMKRNGGLGLSIMRYRASVIGASFQIASRRGRGTTVTCEWRPARKESHGRSVREG